MDEKELTLALATAHECRHYYQYLYSDLLKTHKSSSRLNLQKYNSQFLEIDANAFASLVLKNIYHIEPLFKTLDKDTINKIKQREIEIYNELNK